MNNTTTHTENMNKTVNTATIEVGTLTDMYQTKPTTMRLLDWLRLTRNTVAGRCKSTLPAMMPHGTFIRRRLDGLLHHSGLVQIDLDGKHQRPEIVGKVPWTDVRDAIGQQPWCVYASISNGGHGVYALVAVSGSKETTHRELAETAMDEVLEVLLCQTGYNYRLDGAVSNNLCSLRFPGADRSPWLNMEVTPLEA